jgi:hypothetical protein
MPLLMTVKVNMTPSGHRGRRLGSPDRKPDCGEPAGYPKLFFS